MGTREVENEQPSRNDYPRGRVGVKNFLGKIALLLCHGRIGNPSYEKSLNLFSRASLSPSGSVIRQSSEIAPRFEQEETEATEKARLSVASVSSCSKRLWEAMKLPEIPVT